MEEIDVAAVTNGESWSLSDELEQLPVLDEDGDAVLLPDQPVASVDGDASSNGTRSRKLLTSSDNVVELVFWASRDRMVTMSENVNAFIEETILQVKVMQTFYDKTGFNPRIRLELKHFLYTPSGSTDPWGYYQSSSLVSMLPAVGTWTKSNPAQLSGIGWDALVITLPRTSNHYGPVGYAYMGKICTDQSCERECHSERHGSKCRCRHCSRTRSQHRLCARWSVELWYGFLSRRQLHHGTRLARRRNSIFAVFDSTIRHSYVS